MKKTFNFMAMALILLATACKDDKVHVPVLTVNPEELTFGREGGEATFELTSDSKWVATKGTAGAAWYSIDKTSGELDATIKVTVQLSDQPAERVDTIHLTATSGTTTTARVAIKQVAYYEDILGFVPDANLKTALVELLDGNRDGKVSSTEANGSSVLELSGKQIASLEGLEYVPNLVNLDVSDNTIETIDLAKTPNLTILDCSGNQLTALNLSNVVSLTALNCSDNDLTTLDLSPLTGLTTFDGSGNDWAADNIDISANTQLVNLDLTGTGIVYVNVWSGFAVGNLTYLPEDLRFRGASAPSVAALPAIIEFAQEDAGVTKMLNITSNVDWTINGAPSWVTLSKTEGHDNDQVEITVTAPNNLYGQNLEATFTVAGGGQSFIVTVRQPGVPLPPFTVDKNRIDHPSTAGTENIQILSERKYTIEKYQETAGEDWFTISPEEGIGETNVTITFLENPNKYARLGTITITEFGDGNVMTDLKVLLVRQEGNVIPQDGDDLFLYLPDVNFQNALLGISSIPKTEGKITVGAARAFSTRWFDLYNKNIQSAVGIEFFESAEYLYLGTGNANANHNKITILDLPRSTKLLILEVHRMTELTHVDISSCAALTTFNANYTGLKALDFSGNPALTAVLCNGGISAEIDGSGLLQKIDVTKCPNLTNLQLAFNRLTELDISQNSKLTGTISLRNNYLKTLDFSHLKSVTTLSLEDNSLESVILPKRTQAESSSDLTVQLTNSNYGTGKSQNNVTMLDASECYGARIFRLVGLPNFQMLYFPAAGKHTTPDVQPTETPWTPGPPPTAGQ